MAIYFNDKLLEPKKNGNALEQRYYNEREEVKKIFDRFRKSGEKEATLLFARDFKKVYNRKKTSFKPAPPIAIPMNVNIYDSELGSVQIRYSKNPPIRSENRITWPNAKDESILGERLTVRESQLDYAWFLMKASDYLEKGIIKLVDTQAEYSGKFSSIQQQLAASAMIFDEAITKEQVEAIAEIVLPENVKLKGDSKEELATKLWDFIVKGEESKKSYNYESLIKAGKKVMAAEAHAQAGVNGGLRTIPLSNGDMISVPFLKCHHAVKNEKLAAKMAAFDLPTEGLSRDEIFSIISFKEANLKDE